MTSLIIDIRECDGVFYATCDKIPGFLLCNKDKQQLDGDIRPALEQLLTIKAKHSKKSKPVAVVERREFALAAA